MASEKPPPSSHRDSASPPKWEVENALKTFRLFKEQHDAEIAKLNKENEGLRREVKDAYTEVARLNRIAERDEKADAHRDARGDRFEDRLMKLESRITDNATTRTIATVTPELKADAKLDKAESDKRQRIWTGVGIALGTAFATSVSLISQQCNAPKPDPGVAIPIPSVPTANPANPAGRP
jgi:hypothetical protein